LCAGSAKLLQAVQRDNCTETVIFSFHWSACNALPEGLYRVEYEKRMMDVLMDEEQTWIAKEGLAQCCLLVFLNVLLVLISLFYRSPTFALEASSRVINVQARQSTTAR